MTKSAEVQLELPDCGVRPLVRPQWCRTRYQTEVPGESRTQQAHAESVDVNRIIERFDRTGQLPLPVQEPMYGDVTGLQVDLTEAIERSRQVRSQAEEFQRGWKPPVVDPVKDPPKDPPQDPVV